MGYGGGGGEMGGGVGNTTPSDEIDSWLDTCQIVIDGDGVLSDGYDEVVGGTYVHG